MAWKVLQIKLREILIDKLNLRELKILRNEEEKVDQENNKLNTQKKYLLSLESYKEETRVSEALTRNFLTSFVIPKNMYPTPFILFFQEEILNMVCYII